MNQHYINRYNKFIDRCRNRALDETSYCEFHHIVPLSHGGEDNDLNLIKLTGREHYIAHWILAKAYGGNMWFAFWMMNVDTRNKKLRYKNSIAYEISRQNHSNEISKINKNMITCYDSKNKQYVKITTEEFYLDNLRYSHFSKGKATYKINGKNVVLDITDERIKTGEAVSIRCGYKHPENTILKIKEHSGVKNKRMISNDELNITCYIDINDTLPDGYHYGPLMSTKNKLVKRNKNTFKHIKWITNGSDNKRIYINSPDDLPEGYYFGRTLEHKICEYCGKDVDIANYFQHHGENCKHKGDIV